MNDKLKDRTVTIFDVLLFIGAASAMIFGVAAKNVWIFVPAAIVSVILFCYIEFKDIGEGGEH